jgi:hypothetical protein
LKRCASQSACSVADRECSDPSSATKMFLIISLLRGSAGRLPSVPALYKAATRLYITLVSRREARGRKASFKIEAVLEELKTLAERVGLEVREERLLREVGYHARSGSCRVREKNLLILDRDLAPAARLEVMLEELGDRDLGEIYVSPEVRRLLGKEERA